MIKNDKWMHSEDVETNRIVGTVVNNFNGKEQKTNRIRIHYSKYGTHVVPHYREKVGGLT